MASDGPAGHEGMFMRIGGNLEEMSNLQKTFTTQASATGDLQRQLNTAVDTHITADWEGPAALAFRDAWQQQFKPALDKLQTALNDAASEVRNRREAIEKAGS